MTESASHADLSRKDAGSVAALLRHKRALGFVLILTMCGSLYYYSFATYMQKFLMLSVGLSPETVSFLMTACLLCFMLVQPAFGAMSDKVGTKPMLLVFSGVGALMVIPLFTTLRSATEPLTAAILVLTGLLVLSCYSSISGLIKAHMFPSTIRALGVGLPYAIANAAFGGTAEYVALSMKSANTEHYFFYYLATTAVITFIAVCLMPNLERHGYLDGAGDFEASVGLRRRSAAPSLEPVQRSG